MRGVCGGERALLQEGFASVCVCGVWQPTHAPKVQCKEEEGVPV